MTWVGVAVGGASLLGGVLQGSAAKSAANTQAQAQEQAAQLQYKEFQDIKGMENPYLQSGYSALGQLNYLQGIGTPGKYQTASSSPEGAFGSLNKPFTAQYMKQYSPAYQFQLQQGQQGVLNQDTGGQGALSGAALKDLIGYNQNYANTAFNSAFNQYNTQQQNTFSRLADIANLGQSAASQQAQSGTALAGSQGSFLANAGTAQAAGTIGAANAYSGGLSNLATLTALNQAGGFGGAGSYSPGGYSDLTGLPGAAEG